MKTGPQLKRFFIVLLLILFLAAGATAAADQLPIVFVHGNGDWPEDWGRS